MITSKEYPKKFALLPIKCSCGCGQTRWLEWFWVHSYKRHCNYVGGVIEETDYYSTQEYPTVDDLKNRLNNKYNRDFKDLEGWDDIAPFLTEEDYMELPYNVHSFSLQFDNGLKVSTYYILKVQELPGVQGCSESYDVALSKLKKRKEEYIKEQLSQKKRIPLPEAYDPWFTTWEGTAHNIIKKP